MLFTDIESSTSMLERLGERYLDVLAEHDRLLREAIAACGGSEARRAGDSFFAVFSRPEDAVECARRMQVTLEAGAWPERQPPRVRIGIHTGAPHSVNGEFEGIDVHRAARVMAVAHGGQVLLTEGVTPGLDSSVDVLDLGYHRLKDLSAPEHLFQLLGDGLAREFPALRSMNRSNLPIPASPLVDRVSEVEGALALLSRPEVRLLTLTGPGGVGKTRLAIEVAAQAVSQYRGGVWYVPLALIADPALLVSHIAAVLEVEPVAGEPLERSLCAALAERELLLVLDNLEHLVAAAGVVAEVLASAPEVKVLCTSRELLRIGGEHRMDVPPLAPVHASELFLQRALAVHPELIVTEEDRAAIERICARLDGLPLAVELAAGRIAAFGPRMLDARLTKRLALPAGPRDLPARQRTLRATIDWSYQLLVGPERDLLAALAPFIGGVRLETAESILGSEAVDGLISLSEKNLVRRREDSDSEPRFWMLETIREFAAEQSVANGTAEAAADQHAEYFFALAEAAAAELVGPEQLRWLNRLEDDYPNLRAALAHLRETSPSRAVRMAGALGWFWDTRGYPPEVVRQLTDVLATAPADSPARAGALFWAARFVTILGDPGTSRGMLLEALPLLGEGEERLVVLTLSFLAMTAYALGDHPTGTAYHRQSIAAGRSSGDDWALGVALQNCAATEPHYAPDPPNTRDIEKGIAMFEEALTLLRRAGEPRIIAQATRNLATFVIDTGDLDYAQQLIEEALALSRELRFPMNVVASLINRAVISLARGEQRSASRDLGEAIQIGLGSDIEEEVNLLSTTAILAAMRGEVAHAAMLWAATDQMRRRIRYRERPAVKGLRAKWQEQEQADVPDRTVWDAAWHAGAGMTIDDAVALAATVAMRDL